MYKTENHRLASEIRRISGADPQLIMSPESFVNESDEESDSGDNDDMIDEEVVVVVHGTNLNDSDDLDSNQ